MVLNLTPKNTQRMVYDSIIGKMNKIKKGLYGPNGEKKSITFIDNMGLPLADEHGDQPALEIMHQMLDQKFMYEPSTFQKVRLQNTTVVSCLTTSFGLNQPLSGRVLRHFHAVSTTAPTDESINKIFYFVQKKYKSLFCTV